MNREEILKKAGDWPEVKKILRLFESLQENPPEKWPVFTVNTIYLAVDEADKLKERTGQTCWVIRRTSKGADRVPRGYVVLCQDLLDGLRLPEDYYRVLYRTDT